MPLPSGTRLGPYEITGTLGAGGMGEVYRAIDTTLGRQVAIKVLPDAFAHDADRLARFEREAKTLASLNHPNIAQIYGLEKTNGLQALVMELVEGPTLAERIAQGPIPVDEALPIARQIAEALEAAHEQGVIHRDLKPANVKVRPDGTVKVLDFGLAKAMEPAVSSSPSASMSPTITTPAMTQAGMILGTAAYMSPEQARGKTVDKRADIWAFGAVLFEMLTGQRAFPGEDLTDTLAAVVKLDPMWDAVPTDVSSRVRQVLRVCLQKDPKQRAQAMGDVRLALEGAFETPAVQAMSMTPSSTSRGRLALIAAVAAVLVAALGIPTLRYLRQTPPPVPSETRTEIVTPATDQPASFALSPDGEQIVFVASDGGASRLWLRSLASTTAQSLAGTEGATYPFWAPDNRAIGFFAAGKLKRLTISEGPLQTLADAPTPRGGAWSPSGVIVFAPTGAGPLFSVPASSGEATAVMKLGPGQAGHRAPRYLPDGRHFLFYATGSDDARGIYVGSLDSMQTTRVAFTDMAASYQPPGWLLFVRQGTLVAQQFDISKRELVGDLVIVASSVGFDSTLNVGAFSVSVSGLLAYRSGVAARRQLSWYDRSGTLLNTVGAPAEDELADPELSPDGLRIAVGRTVEARTNVWLLDGPRTSRFTFTADVAGDTLPVWSPDANRIAFRSTGSNGFLDLYQKSSGGAAKEELLLESLQTKSPQDWSPDGRFLLYVVNVPETGADLWMLPLDGERTPFTFLKTRFDERQAEFFPDGRWIAYQSNESGRNEIYIRPFPGPGGQLQASTSGGTQPRWRRDGNELYYLSPEGKLMAVPIRANKSAIEPGVPIVLFQTRIASPATSSYRQQYDVAPDGRFLINTAVEDALTPPITLIQNWNPEAKK